MLTPNDVTSSVTASARRSGANATRSISTLSTTALAITTISAIGHASARVTNSM